MWGATLVLRGAAPLALAQFAFQRYDDRMGAFLKAVVVGILAGAAPFLFFSIPLGLIALFESIDSGHADWGMLWFVISPLVVTSCFVLPACLIFGLPVFWILRHRGQESIEAYVAFGGFLGLLPPLVFIAIYADSWGWAWLGLLGAFSGAFTAFSWAKSRLGTWDNPIVITYPAA